MAAGELFGGAERQIITLCEFLQARGTAFTVYLFKDGMLAAALRERGCSVQLLPGTGRFSPAAVAALNRSLQERDVRIVHVHGYKAMLHCLFLTRGRFAFVKTEHGRPELRSANLPASVRARLYAAVDTIATRAVRAHVVYVTAELRAWFAGRHRGLQGSVIYNGIDTINTDDLNRPAQFLPRQVNVAIVGRLEKVKGIEFALQTMRSPDLAPAIHLHIVGDGPLATSLAATVRELGLETRVTMHGFRRNVFEYIAHADALLVPSLHEGLPYTVLEAMALGTPVLATRVGGLAEVFGDGKVAWLFDAASPGAMVAPLNAIAIDPQLRARMTTAAQAELAARFSAEVMGSAYLQLYAALAAP